MATEEFALTVLQVYAKAAHSPPSFSNFAILALSSSLAQEHEAGTLRGINLPILPLEYRQSSYADHPHLIFDAATPNLFTAKGILDKLATASGQTINWAKSEARWLAAHEK